MESKTAEFSREDPDLLLPSRAATDVSRFFKTAIAFLAGFALMAFGVDRLVGRYLHKTDQRGGLGGDAFFAMERIEKKGEPVRVIFLGDSVARQLFLPRTEPGPAVRFLTTNQAVTMAGQCYLAEDAMRRCPHLREIYLFYLPRAFRNDMPREFTHDYFCGPFHRIDQVAEVFAVKRDFELSFAQAGRCLLPNVMAANSLSRPAFSLEPAAGQAVAAAQAGPLVAPPDAEPLLTDLTAAFRPRDIPPPVAAPGCTPVVLSPTSRYFLTRLRRQCAKRHITLHVLPCPASTVEKFDDVEHVFDAPIINDIDPATLLDAVHFKPPYVAPARRRMIAAYGLGGVVNGK